MKIIKKFKENEKGAITVFVLTALLFMLIVLGIAYISISNKGTSQNKNIEHMAKQYQATADEMNQEYQDVLDNVDLTITEAQNDSMFSKRTNTTTKDSYGNKIVIPAGFKIRVDDTTNNADTVNEGIVIEDEKGNQFVWVPVGNVKTDESGTTVNIELNRYDFATDGTPSVYLKSWTEDTEESHDSSYGNAIAKNITNFINKSKANRGYYIGRYEAGVVNYDTANIVTENSDSETNWTGYTAEEGKDLELVCKTGQQVWNYVTQNKASELARNMYTGKTYESDLINSYAWDTAIVFIQKCSGDTDYSWQGNLQYTTAKTGEATDGTNKDVRCNIYDMAANEGEWSTETGSPSLPCVLRGSDTGDSDSNPNYRDINSVGAAYEYSTFRPILYL